MKNISLDSILLFALIIPYIMTYRLSPGPTPYWLFGFIFLSLFAYLVLDLIKFSNKRYFFFKQVIFWLLVIETIGSSFVSSIIVRHQAAPVYGVHDIILQQESAIQFLLQGKNPYEVTYFGTPLEQWYYSDTEINPALYHFVMQPFYLIFALPFYFLNITFFGFFDGRIPLFFLFLALLIFAARLIKQEKKRLTFLTLLAFNPAVLGYTLEGRSDIFMFAFLFLGLYFLHKQKYFRSGILIALAFAVKQSAWPILPLYLVYVYFKIRNIKKVLLSIFPFFLTSFIVIVPFLVWNAKAFIDSTVLYLSGQASNSYPISGYGLGKLLYELGFIKDLYQYYPFYIWQILIGLPLLGILIKYLKKSTSVSRLILIYGIFVFIFWYLSRYLNNSHLGYLSMVFITAHFWPGENES